MINEVLNITTEINKPLSVTELPTNEVKPKKFRICAKNLFLTYPKCPLDINTVLAIFTAKLFTYGIKDYLIVREAHLNGE
jgi:hypothetical protein